MGDQPLLGIENRSPLLAIATATTRVAKPIANPRIRSRSQPEWKVKPNERHGSPSRKRAQKYPTASAAAKSVARKASWAIAAAVSDGMRDSAKKKTMRTTAADGTVSAITRTIYIRKRHPLLSRPKSLMKISRIGRCILSGFSFLCVISASSAPPRFTCLSFSFTAEAQRTHQR